MKTRAPHSFVASVGFTLIEMVVVLTVIGVVASVGAALLSRAAVNNRDGSERLLLAAEADASLRRVGREIQAALPNSVRVTASGGNTFIEFVPVNTAARFRAEVSSLGDGDPLDFTNVNDSSFDVLGQPISITGSPQLVIGNLGTGLADAYSGNNRRAGVVLTGGGTGVTFTPNGAIPNATGSSSFFLVDTPVTIACLPAADDTAKLVRVSGYGWNATQPSNLTTAPLSGGTQSILLDRVSACSAAYNETLINIGTVLLTVTVRAGATDTTVRLVHQFSVANTP